MAPASTELRQELPVFKTAQNGAGCTCKADIEQKLREQFQRDNIKAKAVKASLQGYGLRLVGSSMRLSPFMNFKISADYPTATGASRHRAKVGVMHFSFCPFCGKGLKEGR